MRFSRCHLRSAFSYAVMYTAIGLAGCANSCFVGVYNNGTGGVIVKAGNPAPTCSLSQAKGTMSALALKSPVCESCTAAAREKHVWVTLRSIQIRPSASDDPNPADWIELAPYLANVPRQIDLKGNSVPVLLVESTIVPAGSYREVRLEFFTGSPGNGEELSAENACREARWNCIMMANGHVEPLRLPGDVPELVIRSQYIESDSLLVLPNARTELRLRLEPHQVAHFSDAEGWTPQTVLVGHAAVVRQQSAEVENSPPD
jgi:hypothetical protein